MILVVVGLDAGAWRVVAATDDLDKAEVLVGDRQDRELVVFPEAETPVRIVGMGYGWSCSGPIGDRTVCWPPDRRGVTLRACMIRAAWWGR